MKTRSHCGLIDSDFAAMMMASDVCVLIHDAQTKEIVWANPAACAMLELDLDDLLPLRANHISSTAQQYDRVVARAHLQQALDTGASRVEWHLRSRSGRIIRTDAFAVRVDLAGGPAVMVQYRDIEREQAVDNEQRLPDPYVEMLTQHTSTIAFMLDRDGTIRSATDTALGHLRRADLATSPVGHPLSNYARFLIGAAEADWPKVASAADPLTPVRLEIGDPDARPVWLEGSVERLPQSESGYLVMLHDVTDRVRGEELRELAQHEANYLARYNAMGDMAMAIAHELGQPLAAAGNYLTGIDGLVGTQAADTGSGDDLAEQIRFGLDATARQIDRAATIVNSLRSFVGHLEHMEEVVDLNDIVRECLPFIRLRAEPAGVQIELEQSGVPVPIRCERVLTGQVLLNLCFNAIDEVGSAPAATRHVLVSTTITDGEGVCTIADRGRGLTRDPFTESFTEKSHGSGIGLALSYRIVTRQHGRIWWQPRDGGGTVFGFALPSPAPR